MLSSPTFRVLARPGWTGNLLLSARPRGGDWLEDEVSAWKRQSVAIVVSLLTPEEEQELDLAKESDELLQSGIRFVSFPIEDRNTPRSAEDFQHLAVSVDSALRDGQNVLVHCRQGIGRTGLLAASVLALAGMDVTTAMDHLSSIRGVPVPETTEQKRWLEKFALNTLAGVFAVSRRRRGYPPARTSYQILF